MILLRQSKDICDNLSLTLLLSHLSLIWGLVQDVGSLVLYCFAYVWYGSPARDGGNPSVMVSLESSAFL